MAPRKKRQEEKIIQVSIGFTGEQIKFMRERKIDISKFCRSKINDYIKNILEIEESLK